MIRFRLVTLTILALVLPAVSPSVGSTPADALAPKKPVLSRVLVPEGPLSGTPVRLVGRNFEGVRQVTFGGVKGRSLKRGGNRITVSAPPRSRPGRVPVRVLTAGGWSRITSATYFTYRVAPTVTGVQPSAGSFAGGEKVTINGSGLIRPTAVTFGGTPAHVLRATDRALTVTAPPGVLGASAVRVTTAGGRNTSGGAYTYVLPDDRQVSELEPADGVVQSSGVEWVTGGNPVDGPEAGVLRPWVVGLHAGAETPALGAYYYLPPGEPVHPAGLAGRVTAVAAQRDGTVRLTIQPDDLTSIFNEFAGSYSGPIGDPATGAKARRSGSRESMFAVRGAGPFDCSNGDNTQAAPIQSSLSFGLENINISEHHEFGAFRTPSIDMALTADLVTGGSIAAEASVTCKIKASWANANRKPFALPIPGLTVSFGPTASLKVTGSGTWSFEKRTKVTMAVSWTAGEPPSVTRVLRETSTKTSASASISVDASMGVSTQLALLDRAGIELTAQVGFKGDITFSTPPPKACVGGEIYGKAAVGLFLDLWVKRWTFDIAEIRIRVLRLELCTDTAESLAESNSPVISSLRMPNGQVAEDYEAQLTTGDDRGGRWAAVSPLPAGLSLDADDGWISGTLTGAVGERAFTVRFTDNEGRTAVETVRLYVLPARGLEGGDVQVTLTWESPADLDLHINDPWGEDIYFNNQIAESGGELDYDANAACSEAQARPTENIHWPYGEAPDGRYDLSVVVYDPCETDDLSWHLQARVKGDVVLDESDYGDSVEYYVTIEDGEVVGVGVLDFEPRPQRRHSKG